MIIGITGANGFLGRFLTGYLIRQGLEVVAMVRTEEQVGYFRELGCGVVTGDLMDVMNCERLVSSVDVIVHLAHSNAPLKVAGDAVRDMVDNLVPSVNLLEAIRRTSGRIRLVYASSGGTVYGQARVRSPFRETDPCIPVTAYGIQKFTIENYIIHYSNLGYLESDILRISNPYGVLLPSTRSQGLVGVVMTNIKEGRPITIFGDPQNVRDYVHLEDVASAFDICIRRVGPGSIYNIGLGAGRSVNEILQMIEGHTGRCLERHLVANERTRSLCDWTVLDVARSQSELGWVPQIKIDQGIGEMCDLYLSHSSEVLGALP